MPPNGSRCGTAAGSQLASSRSGEPTATPSMPVKPRSSSTSSLPAQAPPWSRSCARHPPPRGPVSLPDLRAVAIHSIFTTTIEMDESPMRRPAGTESPRSGVRMRPTGTCATPMVMVSCANEHQRDFPGSCLGPCAPHRERSSSTRDGPPRQVPLREGPCRAFALLTRSLHRSSTPAPVPPRFRRFRARSWHHVFRDFVHPSVQRVFPALIGSAAAGRGARP